MIELLEGYRKNAEKLAELQKTKQSLYRNIHSPCGNVTRGKRNTHSDPTKSAVNKISKVDAEIAQYAECIADQLQTIEDWLQTVPDANVRACVRWHYLCGLDWSETCRKTYGYYNSHTARTAVYRFLGLKK